MVLVLWKIYKMQYKECKTLVRVFVTIYLNQVTPYLNANDFLKMSYPRRLHLAFLILKVVYTQSTKYLFNKLSWFRDATVKTHVVKEHQNNLFHVIQMRALEGVLRMQLLRSKMIKWWYPLLCMEVCRNKILRNFVPGKCYKLFRIMPFMPLSRVH